MAIKIIKQSDTRIQLELTLPNGKVLTIDANEHYEDGISVEVPGTDWKVHLDTFNLESDENTDKETVPRVNLYTEKWADGKEGAPLTLQAKGEKFLLWDDADRTLVRNCPNCGGTGSEVSEGRARAGTDGVPCSRCDHTGTIDIRS